LIFHIKRITVFRIVKRKRPEHHLITDSRLHIFTVQIWNQSVTKPDDMSESLDAVKLIDFLSAGSHGGMVSHKGCKNAKGKPAKQQIFRRVRPKAPEIRSRIQEAAHI